MTTEEFPEIQRLSKFGIKQYDNLGPTGRPPQEKDNFLKHSMASNRLPVSVCQALLETPKSDQKTQTQNAKIPPAELMNALTHLFFESIFYSGQEKAISMERTFS